MFIIRSCEAEIPNDRRFVWDEARYPTMSPLREIVDGIHVQVAKIEDDLKVLYILFVALYYFVIVRLCSA